MRLVDYLRQHALTQPEKVFIYQQAGKEQISYADFWKMVLQKAGTLQGQGWQRGEVYCVRVSPTAGYLSLYFACQYLGVVIAPLENDLPADKLAAIEDRVRGIHLPEEASDILFTTGTTGAAKGVVLSGKSLVADAVNLTGALGFHSDIIFLLNGPVNHFGNHSKVLPVVKEGGSLYLMDGMKNLEDFFGALDFVRGKGKAATFLVPASIRMLMQFSGDRLHAYSDIVDFIETGAAPIAQTDMKELSRLLPDSRLYNTYASSETGVVCTYNFNDGNHFQSCVGKPMELAHVELQDGVVVCSGEALMMGYLGDENLSAAGVGKVVTSDLGRMDNEGRLYLTGRANDIINVGGLKVSPVEVEEAVLSIEGIKDCICIPIPHPLMGFVPKLLVVMSDGFVFNKKAIALSLKQKLESYKVPVRYEQVDHVERTYNGKLNRKAYLV